MNDSYLPEENWVISDTTRKINVKKGNGKGTPFTGHEGPPGDLDARVHIYTATALGRGRLACSRLGRFYPGEITRYSFYRRLSEPQDQPGHEGVKKNLHVSDTQDRTRAIQPAVKRLGAWASRKTHYYTVQISFVYLIFLFQYRNLLYNIRND